MSDGRKITADDRRNLLRRFAVYRSGSVTKFNTDADERAVCHALVDLVILAGWRPPLKTDRPPGPSRERSLFERVFGPDDDEVSLFGRVFGSRR